MNRPPRVLVLGASGMLGSMVLDVLERDDEIEVVAGARRPPRRAVTCDWLVVDVMDDTELSNAVGDADWVVNAVGLIKQRIDESDPQDVEEAIRINSLFPHRLARLTRDRARCIFIATDCVYSGTKGGYVESDVHDPVDVYGSSKSLGEVAAPHVVHLRCSIVGPQPQGTESLLEWFLSQPDGASVDGFTNHRWNGITTLHFARICAGMIRSSRQDDGLQHLVPAGDVSKADLLRAMGGAFGRDVKVGDKPADLAIDRTLATQNPEENLSLWDAAGYTEPPTISGMLRELAGFDYRFKAGL